MDTRATIDSILDKAYAARRSHDAQAAAALFAEDGRFMANGAPAAAKSRAEQLTALKALFDAFEAGQSSSSIAASSTRRAPSCIGAATFGPRTGKWARPTCST